MVRNLKVVFGHLIRLVSPMEPVEHQQVTINWLSEPKTTQNQVKSTQNEQKQSILGEMRERGFETNKKNTTTPFIRRIRTALNNLE